MAIVAKKSPSQWKKLLVVLLLIFLIGAGAAWYIFNEKFADTTTTTAAYTVNALDLIREFEANDSLANKKYAEKIMVVNGIVAELEPADSTVNIKMTDSISGSYIIFAFQEQHAIDTRAIQPGDKVSIKGSCSGGAYSEILETEFITFKRCAINQ